MVRLRSSRIVAPASASASTAIVPPSSPEGSSAASASALSRISEASIKFNSTATPATTLLYPVLDSVEYPSLPLTTPQRTGSRIPTFAATAGKKTEDPDPSFEFQFKSAPDGGGGGGEDAKVKEVAPAVAGRPILKKKRRFSDAHRQQFAKMESIIDHYAAKRTPPARMGLTAENNMPRGVKRSKSRAELGNRDLPSSPSPVKVAVSGPRNVDEDGGSPMKRAKFSVTQGDDDDDGRMTLQKKPSRIARLAGGNAGATPMKGRRHMGTAPATVAGVSMNGRLKLTPSTRLASTIQAGSTPSKIPSGVSTPNVAGTDSTTSAAPAPARKPSVGLAGTPMRDQSLTLAPPNTIGDFTFRNKDNTRGTFKRLSDFHSHNYSLPKPEAENKAPPPAPALKAPLLSGEEDPFVTTSRRGGKQWTPATAAIPGKRKAPHDGEKAEEMVGGLGGGVKKQLRFTEPDELKAEAEVVAGEECGARKMLRFSEPEEPKPRAERVGKDKGGAKRKLDFSAPGGLEEKPASEVAKGVAGKQLKFFSPAEPKPKAEAATRARGGTEIFNFSGPGEPKLKAEQVAQGNGGGRKKLPFSNPAGLKPKPEGSAKESGTRKRLLSSEPDEPGTNLEAPAQEGSPRKRTKLSEPEESKPKPKAAQTTPGKKKASLLKKGKAVLLRSRLNLLAAPKRRTDKDQEGEGKDKGLGRIRWN